MDYYLLTVQQALSELESFIDGLNRGEVRLRLEQYGENVPARTRARLFGLSPAQKLRLSATLLACVLSVCLFYTYGAAEALAAAALAVLGLALGLFHGALAGKAGAALAPPAARAAVRRSGEIHIIEASQIVPGDIVLIKAGDIVPADLRLIESYGLETDETALAGIRLRRAKDALANCFAGSSPSSRDNMAHAGTAVLAGRGAGVAVATGENTVLARLKAKAEPQLPARIYMHIKHILKYAVYITLGAGAAMFSVAMLRERSFLSALDMPLALMCAAIPFILPVAVKITMGFSAVRMREGGLLVRRESAVQTLGEVEIICAGKSAVTRGALEVVATFGDESLLATVFYLCNNAQTTARGEYAGDAVDIALKRYAKQLSITPQSPRVGEAVFDPARRMMSTVHEAAGGVRRQYTKGAPDAILERCGSIFWRGKVEILTESLREQVVEACSQIASQGLLTIGAAWCDYEDDPLEYSHEELEKGMTFIGLCGLSDPVRTGLSAYIDRASGMDARTVLVTGDHPDTACAVGETLGLFENGERIITGESLAAMGDYELDDRLDEYSVFARILPGQRARIANAHALRGKTVAITGANPADAFAMRDAHISIALASSGAEITRDCADAVLENDSLASAVNAMGESRRAVYTVRRTAGFVLASRVGMLVSALVAAFFGVRLLHAPQLLLAALICDALPTTALMLSRAEAEPKSMPRAPALFSGGLITDVLWQGALIAALSLYSFWIGSGKSMENAVAMAFITLTLATALTALNMRAGGHSILSATLGRMPAACTAVAALALSAVFIPGLNTALGFTQIHITRVLIAAMLAAVVTPVAEAVKYVERRKRRADISDKAP